MLPDATAPPTLTGRALAVAAIVVVVLMFVGPISLWPWDHDEVHSLIELGQLPLDSYPGPATQLERMHRLVPVWSMVQNTALRVLPMNEWGTRLIPATCGALTVIFAFLVGTRLRGSWFGWSLLIFIGGSQTLLWLSQQGRFYPLALLAMTLAFASMWLRDSRFRFDVLTMALAGAAVLSHNLTVVLFGLGAVASVLVWTMGGLPWTVVRRALLASATTAAIYLVYLRPILAGWVSGDTGGTPPLISLIAQIGVPTLALAVVGVWATLDDPRERLLRWCSALLLLCLAFILAVPFTLRAWNPRYGLFFMPPMWVMAAAGTATIARALSSKRLAVIWLFAVVLLLAPKLASHFVDGSRHDFRTAAAIVASRAPGDPVLSNWPAELQYYLEPKTGQRPQYWNPAQPLPAAETVVVVASNAWEPVLQVNRRAVQVVGQVGRRRFDEQSHLIRIYIISALER